MSKKGTTWSKHKYIRIENGHYIYKENSAKESKQIDTALKGYDGTIKSLNPNLIKGMSRSAISGLAASLIARNKERLKNFKLGKGKSGSSSSKSSGGKGSGEKKSSEKKGSSKEKTSSEKTTKESTSSKATETTKQEETVQEVSTPEYTKRLEEFVNKDRSKLPIIYEWAENELKKQKIKHYDAESPYMVNSKIFTSTDEKLDLNFLEHSFKGTTWFKKDAKYTKRVKSKNGKWVYYYNQVKKYVKEGVDKVKTLCKNLYNKVKNRKLKDIEVTDKETKSKVESIKKENASFSLTDVIKQFKYYKKVQLPNGKWRYFYSEDEYKRYTQRNKYLDKDYDFMQDVPGTNKPLTPRKAAKEADVGTDAGNCSSCSIAFELLMRGYDVQSKPDIDGATPDEIASAFGIKYTAENNWYLDTSKKENKNYYSKGLKKTSEETRLQMAQDDLEKTIIDRGGENQRGFMRISWTQTDPDENGNRSRSGGGHIFNYVVEDGNVKFYDSQKGESNNQRGKEIDIKEYLDNTDYITHSSLKNGGYATYCGFYRVDDKDLSPSVKDFINYTPEEVHTSPEEIKDTGSLYRKGYPSTLTNYQYETKRKK